MLTKYEMLFKTDTVCQKSDAKNQMLKNVNMIYQVTNTPRKSWNIKKLRRKVNMLQCPSSLKQMNFKTECFSSLLVTINTEVIIFNIRLSAIAKLNHEIQEQWHFAVMLVYDSIHPWARSKEPLIFFAPFILEPGSSQALITRFLPRSDQGIIHAVS